MGSPTDSDFEGGKTLFLRGVAALEAGQFDSAESCFLESLTLVPGRVSTLLNLAAARLLRGDGHGAIDAARQVHAIEPRNAEAALHEASSLVLLGQHADALEAWTRALAFGAPPASTWLRHGESLQALGRSTQALGSFDRALAADPSLAQAWTHRGNLLREMHRASEAAEAFRQALHHGGDAELLGYYLASLGGAALPDIAPPHYVATLFDDYAEEFERHLVGTLKYDAHRVLTAPLSGFGRAPMGAPSTWAAAPACAGRWSSPSFNSSKASIFQHACCRKRRSSACTTACRRATSLPTLPLRPAPWTCCSRPMCSSTSANSIRSSERLDA